MNRRKFGLAGASGIAAASAGLALPRAASAAAQQAAQLKGSTLTPLGAERAGNADGSIPAWSGGMTTPAAGWTDGQPQPDFFPNEKPTLVINQANMAQYQDKLPFGIMQMMQKYGYTVQVYPTHRTAAAPQWVYDNTYQNALNASLDPKGGRFGFKNGYGGIVFPILDSDPTVAGVQCIWNHLTSWNGYCTTTPAVDVIAADGTISISATSTYAVKRPYYNPNGSLADFDGWLTLTRNDFTGPPVLVGRINEGWQSTNSLTQPALGWSLLNGQGRVRQAPNLTYDTPLPANGGIINYDEANGYGGQPNKYNWKLAGKKEMYVAYNNNVLLKTPSSTALKPHFLSSDLTRYELHRVYVVDAVLAPGERHSMPHRRFYIDEDTWHVLHAEAWDGNGNFWKEIIVYNLIAPNLPGTIYGQAAVHDLQRDQYSIGPGLLGQGGINFSPISGNYYNPAALAAASQY